MYRRIILGAMMLMLATGSQNLVAQAGKGKTKAKTQTDTQKPDLNSTQRVEMKTLIDSVSYVLGMNLINTVKQQQMLVNPAVVMQSLRDGFESKFVMSDDEMMKVYMRYEAIKAEEKAGPNKVKGKEFLAENAKKEGVTTLPSGLQYKVITQGTGAKPTSKDKVKVHYRGTLIDGKEFDSSIKRNEPVSFNLDGVIKGWTEGVQLMPVGSKYMLYIPAELGYGDKEVGNGLIPAGSTLVFEVELLEIVK